MRVLVWNSFGGRIAPLDTFQHVVPGGITFLTKIYTSHAADVCRPLSLFLLLYCYCIIVQTAQDRQGTVHARVCYCYRLVLDNTETH